MRDRATQAKAVLAAITTAGRHGVTNLELNKLCLRYGGRIFELRQEGHNIKGENEGKGIWRFTLHPPEPVQQILLFEGEKCESPRSR